MLRHPDKVRGFFGINTSGPWYTVDFTFLGGLWRLWYQVSIALPIVGPRIIGDRSGRYAHRRIDVPVRMLHGAEDPVITATLLRGYADHMRDVEVETLEDAGHWIVEQRPGLVLHRLRAFLAGS
jgi:pimeloyl-ACP methyl ester carboxylesterase